MRWAVICEKTDRVYNCVEWDGKAKWHPGTCPCDINNTPNSGYYLIQTDEGDRYDLHDKNNKKFIKHHNISDWPEFKPEEGKP